MSKLNRLDVAMIVNEAMYESNVKIHRNLGKVEQDLKALKFYNRNIPKKLSNQLNDTQTMLRIVNQALEEIFEQLEGIYHESAGI